MTEHVTRLELHHDGTFEECCENALDAATLLIRHGFAAGVKETLPSMVGEPDCSQLMGDDE